MTNSRSHTTTVVVITHNYGRYLPTAVASACDQTHQPRVLVMDDGSTDGTEDVVRDLAARYPLLTCHRSATARGPAATRNDAATRVETEWIIYLDADDWLDLRFVERGEHWLARQPACDVLTTDNTVVEEGRPPKLIRTRAPRTWRDLRRRNAVRQTSFIRRSMIVALSGYDGTFKYEDWEFWIRALKAGYTFGRLPGAYVYHRRHGLSLGAAADKVLATQALLDRHGAPSRWEQLRLRLTGW